MTYDVKTIHHLGIMKNSLDVERSNSEAHSPMSSFLLFDQQMRFY